MEPLTTLGAAMLFVLYSRVSTAEQGDSRNGLEAQQASMRGFVERLGGTVLACVEEVVSGTVEPSARPVLTSAAELARRHGASLLVARLDRLSRSVEHIARLMNSGAPFYTVEDGLQAGPLQLHIKAAFAEQERRLISERTKAGLQAAKARGVVLGIGAHKNPSLSGPKARAAAGAAVRAGADSFALQVAPTVQRLRAHGFGLAQVAAELNTLGVQTARGGRWDAPAVCRVLKRLDSLKNSGG